MKKLLRYWPLLILVAIVAFAIYALTKPDNSKNANNKSASTAVLSSPDGLPGLLTTPAPWPKNTDQLAQRLDKIHLPQLNAEGNALHIHQHIDIFVDGHQVPVPADIGVPTPESFISPIHVHDDTGVLHVESPTVQDYYLGQFFDVWGVKFDGNDLGGYHVSGDKQLAVYVNGQKTSGDPRQVKLDAHQEIVVTYGTASELPNPIPASFQFGEGL